MSYQCTDPNHDGWCNFALDLESRLPFCGCGTGDELLVMLRDYIAQDGNTFTFDRQDVAAELIAHIADHAGLTEHGTSIYWCWRTTDGDRALELWEARGVYDWAYCGERMAGES